MATLEDIPIELLFEMMVKNPEIISSLTKVSKNAYDMVYRSKNEGEEYSVYFQDIMDKTRRHTADGDYIFNGLKDGLWRELNPSTGLFDVRNYQFGKLEGESIIYNNINVDTPLSIVKYNFFYKNGKLDGKAFIYHSDLTASTLTYRHGVLHGDISLNTDYFSYKGQFKNGIPDGRWKITAHREKISVEFENDMTHIINPSKIYDNIEILHSPFIDSYNLPPKDIIELIDGFNILSKPITIKCFKDDKLIGTYVFPNDIPMYIGQDIFYPEIKWYKKFYRELLPQVESGSPLFYDNGQKIGLSYGGTSANFIFSQGKLSSIDVAQRMQYTRAEFNNLLLTSNNINNVFKETKIESDKAVAYAYALFARYMLTFIISKSRRRLLDLKIPGITFETFEPATGVIDSTFHNINYGITEKETYFDYISKVDGRLEAEVIIDHVTGEQKYKLYSNK